MKRYPLITVYITNYNYEKYIKQSIESVLCQSFKNFELLIIDDGSIDGSRNIIEQYNDYKKVSIIYQKNKGLNVTNNIAMRVANGKYIMRLDADDYLHKDALKLMVEKLESDETLGLVFPDYYYVDSYGNITGEERRYNFEEEVSLYDLPAHGACTMIRLKFLKELGGYNESFSCQDGYDLWIKFTMRYKVANINVPLFYYRRHQNNLTNNELRILNTRKEIKETFLKRIKKEIPSTTAIIPVRSSHIGNHNWPFYEIEGKTILENKIEVALEANKISSVVVTSSEKEVIEFIKEKYYENEKVHIIYRPKKYAKVNESLINTLKYVLDILAKKYIYTEAIMMLSLEYPFTTSNTLDDAINTLMIFNTDTVLSVRQNNLTHYRHTGHGLEVILEQDKFTKLEREALYTGAGGIVLTTKQSFLQNEKIIAGTIGHIVVDSKTAQGVFNGFDLDVFSCLINKKNEGSE